jgi:hypothetical protein
VGDDLADPFRRSASFVVFLFPLVLSFVEFRPEDVDTFKKAVILVCLYRSVKSFVFLIFVSGMGTFDLKNVLGSQRFGFILCLGFFMALFSEKLFWKKRVFLQRIRFVCPYCWEYCSPSRAHQYCLLGRGLCVPFFCGSLKTEASGPLWTASTC